MFEFVLKFVLRYFKKDLTTILKVFDKALHELQAYVETNTSESAAKVATANALLVEAAAQKAEADKAAAVQAKIAKLVA